MNVLIVGCGQTMDFETLTEENYMSVVDEAGRVCDISVGPETVRALLAFVLYRDPEDVDTSDEDSMGQHAVGEVEGGVVPNGSLAEVSDEVEPESPSVSEVFSLFSTPEGQPIT